MTDIATIEPAALVAGDTWSWQRTLSDYPASTWTLTYYLRGVNGEASFAAAASGGDHLVTVAKATTAAYKAGDYEMLGLVTDGTSRYTVYRGRFTIQPDPANIGAGHDPRSHSRKVYEAIQAVIEKRATKDQQEYMIAGRKLVMTPLPELMKMLNFYESRVAGEVAAENLSKGVGRPTGLQVRM
jgi:hypothetical protein